MELRTANKVKRQDQPTLNGSANASSLKFSRTLPSGSLYSALQAAYRALPEKSSRPGDFSFTRGGALSIELLTAFLLHAVADGNRYGIRHLLQDFWEDALNQGIVLPGALPVTASAICQARHKLPPTLFRDLLTALAGQVTGETGGCRWHGRRLLAVDGALINVRRSPDLSEAFGVAENTYTPQARYSVLVDVLLRMPIDYRVGGRMAVSEREQLFSMLPAFQARDLLLLDRGYPSYEVLRVLTESKIDFVMRCSRSQSFKFIDAFRASGAQEAVIHVDLEQLGNEVAPKTRLRLIRSDGGEGPVFFITSLAKKEASVEEIKDLYHLRWEVEEYFKLATGDYAGQKQLRSMTPFGVKQELGALTLYLAMSRVLACEAEAREEVDPGKCVSQKGAVKALHRHLIGLLLDGDPERTRIRIEQAITRLLHALDRRRRSRSFARVSMKPRRKWGPRGKTRA